MNRLFIYYIKLDGQTSLGLELKLETKGKPIISSSTWINMFYSKCENKIKIKFEIRITLSMFSCPFLVFIVNYLLLVYLTEIKSKYILFAFKCNAGANKHQNAM